MASPGPLLSVAGRASVLSGRKALELYLDTPELIVASILVAIAIFGFAWWLHSHISKERIATLQDRLRIGKQIQEHITNELDSLKITISRQEAILNDLHSTGGVPRSQVELLSSANAAVISSLADLEQANTNLGATLTLQEREFTNRELTVRHNS
jgi:hypothetical protein